MRPEKLELQYFGPYTHEVIDFNQFKNHALFLVAGNTGAGKTTIFDAICYALFGQTTSKARSAAELRSDFAPADQPTKVTFTFTHQGHRYRITRQPKQGLQGRRGKKVERAQKISLVYPLDSDQPQEITKVGDAEQFIVKLLNMTADQFSQIVLIPQGKFRQFLDSDSNTKQELLQDLFQTGRYAEWTAKLKEQLKDQQGRVKDQQGRLQAQKESLSMLDSQLPTDDWLPLAMKLQEKLTQQLTSLHKAEETSQSKVATLTKQLHSEQDLHNNLAALATTTAVQRQLAAKQSQITTIQQRIANLEWYRDHAATYQRFLDSQAELKKQQAQTRDLTQQRQQLTNEITEAEQAQASLTGKQPAMEQLRDQVRDIQGKLPLFAEVQRLRVATKKATDQVDRLNKQQGSLDQECAVIERQLTTLKSQLADSKQLADQQLKLEQRKSWLRELKQAGQELKTSLAAIVTQQTQSAELKKNVATKEHVVGQLNNQLTTLKDSHARQQIALLARDLKSGTPCPVCGAIDHPQPAHFAVESDPVTDRQIKEAEHACQVAQDDLSKYEERYRQSLQGEHKLQSQIETQQATLAHLLQQPKLSDEWVQLINDQETQLDYEQAALEKQEKLAQIQAQRQSKLEQQITEKQAAEQKLLTEVHQAKQQLVKDQTSLAEKQSLLPPKISDEVTAKQRLQEWQTKLAAFDQQLTALDQQLTKQRQALAVAESKITQNKQLISQLTERQDQQQRALLAALQNYQPDFDWSFFSQAQHEVGQLAALQQQLASHENQVRENKQEIRRLTTLIDGRSSPDLQAARQALEQAQNELQAKQEMIGQVKNQRQQVQNVYVRVDKLQKQVGQLGTRLNQLETLTAVMDGKTENHLSLNKYVLQSYFKDILVVANEQLRRLTNGRYQFELAQESHGAGAKWSGLEINVYDDNAGRSRSAHTLSGGESFIASLALALALCQIIQEQNGGIQIDALFIDEGFGSLDQEALADALRTLEELQGHRMIGIISHVTELEEQIPDQLRVKSQDGRSTVTYRHEL